MRTTVEHDPGDGIGVSFSLTVSVCEDDLPHYPEQVGGGDDVVATKRARDAVAAAQLRAAHAGAAYVMGLDLGGAR